jgi:hypothetical protein
MAISIATGPWRDLYPDDRSAMGAFAELIHRLLTEGVNQHLQQQYSDFRELILDNPEYADVVPPLLRKSRTAEQFQAELGKEPNDDERVATAMGQLREIFVRADQLSVPEDRGFEPSMRAPANARSLFELEDATETGRFLEVDDAVSSTTSDEPTLTSSTWTGVPSRVARLVSMRAELGIAQASVQHLIDQLAAADGNGGPLLDEHADALDALRQLHRNLTELLDAIDGGVLNDELGEGLAASIARWGSRAGQELRSDPGRWTVLCAAFAVLSATGLVQLVDLFAGAAMTLGQKKAG